MQTNRELLILARLSIYAPSRSDCEILLQVMRWYFWLVYALQASKITLKRLRGLLFGKSLKPSPGSQDASGSGQAGDDETKADGVLEADAVGTVVTAGEAPPQLSPSPESDKPKGGHRPGTGRLGADAYVGAERVECRHDELAAGQRCPVCGQIDITQTAREGSGIFIRRGGVHHQTRNHFHDTPFGIAGLLLHYCK